MTPASGATGNAAAAQARDARIGEPSQLLVENTEEHTGSFRATAASHEGVAHTGRQLAEKEEETVLQSQTVSLAYNTRRGKLLAAAGATQ